MRSFILLVFFLCLFPAALRAQAVKQPDLISVEGGYYDFDKTDPHKQSVDLRLEYRWGVSLLPFISSYFKKWDGDFQVHPFIGNEIISRGSYYGLGGFASDWYTSRHTVFTWSEGCGFYYRGNGPRMGSVFQFRSMAELGWRFDNDVRITGELSHISDAKITRFNPGAEIGGIYLHIPTTLLAGS